MHIYTTTFSTTLPAIVRGGRLLAIANGQNPDTMEQIIRRSARVAAQAALYVAADQTANDKE